MQAWRGLASGFAGACAMTLVHQTARRFVSGSPRLDALGSRAIAKGMRGLNQKPPHGEALNQVALVGDIVTNALLFSLVDANDGADAVPIGALVGLGAGIGSVLLPEPLGLGRQPGEQDPKTPLLTVAWYVIGGLTAATVCHALAARE